MWIQADRTELAKRDLVEGWVAATVVYLLVFDLDCYCSALRSLRFFALLACCVAVAVLTVGGETVTIMACKQLVPFIDRL